jgi:hypothetical protein
MSTIQNRDVLHVQDDSPEGWSEQFETPAQVAAEDYAAVRVHVTNPVETTTGATQFGVYETIVIPPATVQQVLPRDDLRQYGYITAVDAALVIGTTLEQVQGSNNLVASTPFPSGAYLPLGATTPPIRHNDPVYAVNTSATLNCRVVVLIERGAVR